MGCNTSQELKTKDGTNAAMNGDGACDGGIGSNSNNLSGEQNGNIIENRSQRTGSCSGSGGIGGGSGGSGGADGQIKSALSHANHPKSNSIMTNGDASTVKHPRGDSTGFDSAKHHHQQHHGLFNGDSRGQCEKAELSEFNDIELGEDEAKAATKIQAAFRGHQVRSTMKKSETKTSSSATNTNNQNQQSSSAAAAGAAKNDTASTAAAEEDPSKAELEAEFDPNDKELCDAAMKIQATFRGHLARKLVNKDAPEDDDIKEITKKVAEELDIDLTDPELNKAATKIQASFRGHKTRKEVGPSAE